MSFNSVGHYSASHKTWDHLGNIFPNVEHSEGERPAGEFKPAEWLPVQFYDKYFEDWYVCLPGKIVALDNDGRVVPAQYNTSSGVITYSQDDVDVGTIDVETGVAVTATKTVTVSAVTTFMGRAATSLAVSKPVGVAPYGYLQWAGGDGSNPANLTKHNYQRQHQVAILCDYVLTLPLVPGKVTADVVTWSAAASNKSTGTVDNTPVAKNTSRTPITFTGTDLALFVNEVATAALVKASGDWHIDLTTGVVTVYKASGTPVANVTYYSYKITPASVSKFASARGDLKPGDFVKADADSNFVLDSSPSLDVTVGQVLEVVSFPRSGLEYVKTAYTPALGTSATGSLPGTAGQMDQMPGSATGGMPDAVHYAGASNKMVVINLISR